MKKYLLGLLLPGFILLFFNLFPGVGDNTLSNTSQSSTMPLPGAFSVTGLHTEPACQETGTEMPAVRDFTENTASGTNVEDKMQNQTIENSEEENSKDKEDLHEPYQENPSMPGNTASLLEDTSPGKDEGEKTNPEDTGTNKEKEETNTVTAEETEEQAGNSKDTEKSHNPRPEPTESREDKETNHPEEENNETSALDEYQWKNSRHYRLQVKVNVNNRGDSTAKEVSVKLPMLENSSAYQQTTLESTSHPAASSSGRNSSFSVGEIAPGETVTVTADYTIRVNTFSMDNSSTAMETAKETFKKLSGSGNCHDLAVRFVEELDDKGIKARVVTGFANPERGSFSPGSLGGMRHSWAEFYIEGTGWIPADLTFGYFAELPSASHIIETYSAFDAINLSGNGGELDGSWENVILE